MFDLFGTSFNDLMSRGGFVMWPLLILSVVAVTLSFERCWFWLKTNSPSNKAKVWRMAQFMRQGEMQRAREIAGGEGNVYCRLVWLMLSENPSPALASEAVESQRPRLERFMSTLSTIITAAPMLGILGTVLGIIASFNVLDLSQSTDPRLVSQGIAEALLTTAVGLVLAIIVLLPYNLFRTQMDRSLGRLEVLVAAALGDGDADSDKSSDAASDSKKND